MRPAPGSACPVKCEAYFIGALLLNRELFSGAEEVIRFLCGGNEMRNTKKVRIRNLSSFQFLLFSILLTSLILSPGIALGARWYVKTDGSDSNGGQTWNQAFKTIQKAVMEASDGDEIWVKMGPYPLSSTIDVPKAVGIYGGFAGWEFERDQRNWQKNTTKVDGQKTVNHCLYVTSDATIDGFTIVRGWADSETPHDRGGGIYNDTCSPTITNCTFSQNYAVHFGGGIYNYSGSPTITNCVFAENTMSTGGGGISNFNASPTISNCSFRGNDSYTGGAIDNENSPSTITNCSFWFNTAVYSAGIRNYNSSATITNCSFWGNTAENKGGAIINDYFSSGTITNCILWGDSATDWPEIYDYLSYPNVSYCDIDQDGVAGSNGNIRQDPLFLDPDNGDFHLGQGSPCIDAGTNDAPALPDTDFEGDPRIIGSAPDMGADEYAKGNGDGVTRYHALLIGCGRGWGDPLNDILINDVDRVYATLVDSTTNWDPNLIQRRKGYEVSSTDQILLYIESIISPNMEGDDVFLLYFSGHGNVNGLTMWSDTFTPTHLRSALDFLPPGVRSIVALNACRSGVFIEDFKSNPRENTFILSSSKADQYTPAYNWIVEYPWFNTLFTHYFSAAISGKGDSDRNGEVSFNEAFEYIKDRTGLWDYDFAELFRPDIWNAGEGLPTREKYPEEGSTLAITVPLEPPEDVKSAITIAVASPVDLKIMDPESRVISKTENQIPDAIYTEYDYLGNQDPADIVTIINPKPGNYFIEVVPEPDSSPDDTYSFYVSRLLDGNWIEEISDEDKQVGQGKQYVYTISGDYVLKYSEDFSADPGWETNNASRFYRDVSSNTFYAMAVERADEYATTPINWTGNSFKIEFDIEIASSQWASGISVGLFDSDRNDSQPDVVDVIYGQSDDGLHVKLHAANSTKSDGAPSYIQNVQHNVWYHNVVTWDKDTGVVTLELKERDTGSLIGTYTIDVLPLLLPTWSIWVCPGLATTHPQTIPPRMLTM